MPSAFPTHKPPRPPDRIGTNALVPVTSTCSTSPISDPLGATDAGSSSRVSSAISLDKEVEEKLKALSQRKKPKRKKQPILLNVSLTKYFVVRLVAEQFGVLTDKDDDVNCFLFWSDSSVPAERISELKSYQSINHFPAMGEICRKDCLARNMARMIRAHPEAYSFVPKTWIFPSEYTMFQNYARDLKKRRKPKTFIVKPANGAMGNGISLYKNSDKVPLNEHMIVQEYMDKPFLLDGYKFDLRVYVLMTSCDPLRLFLYNDGLVRMSTEKYTMPNENNVDQLFMHLTNYSINKKSDNFERSEDVSTGHKRSIKYLNDYLRKNDHDVNAVWNKISDLLVKTLIVAEPHILHAYRMCRPGQATGSDGVCFEILGFDVLLDRKLRPWLLEINRAPSFGTDEKIDFDIKSGLLYDAFKLLNMKLSDKRKGIAAQKAEIQKRLFRSAKRSNTDLTDLDRRRRSIEKRKSELKEKLAQINRAPSFGTDEKIDFDIKSGLLYDAFKLLNMKLSDKRKGIAAQKAETQKRLFRSAKRSNTDLTDLDRRRRSIEKRKSELKEKLAQVRRENAKEDYENRNSGRYRRIYPPPDKLTAEKYNILLTDAFQLFLSGRASSLKRDVSKIFGGNLKEDEILNMLQQCDLDAGRGQSAKGPKPLACMPSVVDEDPENDGMSCDLMEDGDIMNSSTTSSRMSRTISRATQLTPMLHQRTKSAQRPVSKPLAATKNAFGAPRSRSLTRPTSSSRQSSGEDEASAYAAREREDELTRRTLGALNEMRIKFPGKTDEEAGWILDQINDNWKYHKPRIASYWLVKLDSIKRRKVIDIVRSNVRAVLQRTWRSGDIDSLRLYRIFNRVFNRLLWSHGQGLWNCFSTSGNSWETIFSKSSDVISPPEMSCSRRIVQLCRDCLLIVYQFAAEAKGQGLSLAAASGEGTPAPHIKTTPNPMMTTPIPHRSVFSRSNIVTPGTAPPMTPLSQRMSRIYKSKSFDDL